MLTDNLWQSGNNKRHAYLISAYNEFALLKLLIKSLDDKRNDIFVAMDAKAKDFNEQNFVNITKYSKLVFVRRIKSYWAAFTQVDFILLMMKEASRNNYEYYHMISGVDIPLKSQDDIHLFFNEHRGMEFVDIWKKSAQEMKRDYETVTSFRQKCIDLFRVKHYDHSIRYYFTQKHLNIQRANIIDKIIGILGRLSVAVQKILGIVRNKDIKIYTGSDWFSITNNLVNLVLEKEDWIREKLQYTFCPSQLFVNTVLKNSYLEENIYNDTSSTSANLRYIIWTRDPKLGIPYIFRSTDYESLLNSRCLFARKFSIAIDKEIIKKLYYRLLPKDVVDEILS